MAGWKEVIRGSRLLRPLRLARLRLIARHGGHENWRQLLAKDEARWNALIADAAAPKVLIATSIGGHFALNAIDRMLGVALTLRGAKVVTGLCDGMMAACQMCEINLLPASRMVENGPQTDICGYCATPAIKAVQEAGLLVRTYGAYVDEALRSEAAGIAARLPLDEIGVYQWRDIPVGEHAQAGALRYFARGDMEKEAAAEPVLRRYLEASILVSAALDKLVAQERPDVIVAHHGIYVPQGLVAAIAHKHDVRLVTWNQAYRAKCFIFSHDETYHRTMMSEAPDVWRDRPFSDAERELVETYLKSRWYGTKDWISFQPPPDLTLTEDISRLGLDPHKPLIVALTNVFWDAQIHYPANAFATQRDWLVTTARWFKARPDLQLAIRIHPAELTGTPRSRQFAAEVLKEAMGTLPPNIVVIGPESPVSTYDLARASRGAIIFATKTGIELTSMGIPTIVAGEAWIRGKGLTMDAATLDEYFSLLDQLPFPDRLDEETRERALRFAFHFFFRRMIPLAFIESYAGPRRFRTAIDGIAPLMPGASAGLDVICDGILKGTPFHMDEAAALAFAGDSA